MESPSTNPHGEQPASPVPIEKKSEVLEETPTAISISPEANLDGVGVGAGLTSKVTDSTPLIAEIPSSITSSSINENKINLAPVIRQPSWISAQDPIWGDNPDLFWVEQAQACEHYDSSRTTAELIEFANRIDAATPQAIAPWHEPIIIPENTDFWIIGDIHGDLLAFKALTEFAKRTSAKCGRTAAWCFLGDLFDDGQYGHAVLHEVLSLVDQKAGFLVAGNHDLALYWNEADCRFGGDVSPHDFADWLNGKTAEDPWRKVAMAATRWFKNSPRAILLEDGTLIAHGGCVHADRLALLDEPGGLLQPGVLEDLVWLRAHDTSKRKIPNRTGRGCQFGYEDFRDFLKKISDVLERPIHRVIRGHDHVLHRWASPIKYEGRLLTINAMSWRQREVIGPFVRQPVIARHSPNEFPDLFTVEIPGEIVERLYGQKVENQCSTSGN